MNVTNTRVRFEQRRVAETRSRLMFNTSAPYSRVYQRSKEFAQTLSRISKRDLRTWKQGPQCRSAARNASPRSFANCSRDAITSTRTASQAPPKTSFLACDSRRKHKDSG